MKFPQINFKSSTFIKIATLLLVFVVIFVPKDGLRKFFSRTGSQLATVFTASTSGDWNSHTTWGISAPTPINQPEGVALSPTGEIYIGDSSNNRIVVLNPDGTASTTFDGSASTTLGSFSSFDLTLSSTGQIYVLDVFDHRVVVFNPDGTVVATYDNLDAGYSPAGFGDVEEGIALSPTGEIYIADGGTGHNRVVVLNPDGTASTTYDNLDAGYFPAGLNTPRGIAISPTGEIYVSDRGNNRIVVLNADGTASTTFDAVGLNNPRQIAISPTGEIYISDMPNNRIVVLNADGTASTTYDNLDAIYSPAGEASPRGITISPTGEIYIADSDNNRIVVLNPDGTASTTFDGTAISISGGAGTFYPGQNNNVVINTGTVTLTRDESVHNLILASGGTLDLNGHTLNVYGDWSNTGGTLTSGAGGTIDLKGSSSQYIIGTNTFQNLTKITSATSSLFFDPNNTTTITGDLILRGAFGNLLSVAPSISTMVFDSKISGSVSNPGFHLPKSIALSPTGEIYISDLNANRIVVLKANGSAFTSYNGSASTTLGAFTPFELVVSSTTGKIYIADSNFSRIVVLNSDGTAFASYDGSASTTLGGFNPEGMALSSTGEIYVSDNANDRIVVLNSDGTVLRTIDAPGGATGIKISSTGKIYLAHSQINILNSDGTTFASYDGSASTTLGAFSPVSMALSPTDEIYAADFSHNRIVVFDSDGTVLASYDGSASTTLGLFSPTSVTLSPTGEIYVTDTSNNRIAVLNSDGTASTTYDNTTTDGPFTNPDGLTRDSQDNIYVTDNTNDVIQEFDKNRNFVRTLDTTGIPAPITNMLFLGVDGSDNIYTVDQNTKRLVKFVNGVYSASTILTYNVYGFAVSPSGNIYYNDASDKIQKLDSNLNVVATAATIIDGLHLGLGYPMAIDATGNFVYVIDGNDRILKLNASDLSFVSSIRTTILPFDYFSFSIGQITSFTFDSQNNIYLGNRSDNNITVYSPDFGAKLAQFGTNGSGNGQFNFSNDQLVLDSHNNLYVSDNGNDRIQKFSPVLQPFNIISSGTASTSYLSISSSTNQSGFSFSCLTGCIDGGNNANWIFTTQTTRTHRTTYNTPLAPVITPTITATTTEATSTPTTVPILVPSSPQHFIFTQTLRLGSIGEDVRQLQIFLNSNGYTVSTQGAGSRGQETRYFGPKTYKSLIKFQEDYKNAILVPQGLAYPTGVFWDYTRKLINFILGR